MPKHLAKTEGDAPEDCHMPTHLGLDPCASMPGMQYFSTLKHFKSLQIPPLGGDPNTPPNGKASSEPVPLDRPTGLARLLAGLARRRFSKA